MLRPITKPIATALITISFASVAFAQELNGHLQVFVTGGMMGRAFTTSVGPQSTTENDALDVTRNIQPGVEIVFKPRSRISFGASFARLSFATKLKDHNVIYKDSFTYLGPDGRPAVYGVRPEHLAPGASGLPVEVVVVEMGPKVIPQRRHEPA